jgi:hypothetical protein
MTQPSLLDDDMPLDLAYGVELLIAQHGWGVVLAEVRRQTPSQIVPSAPARTFDPETSHNAGPRLHDVGKFSSKSRQARLLSVFATQPLTDQQATVRVVGTAAVPSAFDGCRRRCSDLRAVGYISDTGRRRKNAGSDDESIVWQITDAGRHALINLDHTGWSR